MAGFLYKFLTYISVINGMHTIYNNLYHKVAYFKDLYLNCFGLNMSDIIISINKSEKV